MQFSSEGEVAAEKLAESELRRLWGQRAHGEL